MSLIRRLDSWITWGVAGVAIGLGLGVNNASVVLVAAGLGAFILYLALHGEAEEETEGNRFAGGASSLWVGCWVSWSGAWYSDTRGVAKLAIVPHVTVSGASLCKARSGSILTGTRSSIKASLFVTCVVDQFYPQVGESTARVLDRLGVDLNFPRDRPAAGSPPLTRGSGTT